MTGRRGNAQVISSPSLFTPTDAHVLLEFSYFIFQLEPVTHSLETCPGEPHLSPNDN